MIRLCRLANVRSIRLRQHIIPHRFDLGVPASAADAQARREQWMSSRGSCIGYKGGRAGREAVHTLVRGCPSRSLARAVIGV